MQTRDGFALRWGGRFRESVPGSGRIGTICVSLGLAGCSSPAPYQNLLGSFFPSWMLCVLAGLVATVAVHRVLVAVKLAQVLPVPLLTYMAITAAFTFWAWLAWLG